MDSSFFLFLLLLLPSFSSSTTTIHPYQTLLPDPLPSKPPLITETPSTTTTSSPSSETTHDFPNEETTASTFLLQHVDAFSSETSPQSLFLSRLDRDAARVSQLTQTRPPPPRAAAADDGEGFAAGVISGLRWGSGEYFTRLGIGTPTNYYYFVLDTGSDIIWLQCSPCVKCYKQADAIFDPSRSSTLKRIPCDSPLCPHPTCGPTPLHGCAYGVSYGDGSTTAGDLVQESLHFGKREVKNIALGCGYNNTGLFVGAAGLLGLGRGELGLLSQASASSMRRVFSYCLAKRNSASGSNNGRSTVIFGAPALSASAAYVPLAGGGKVENFYYLGMTGLWVGGRRVTGVRESMFGVDGGGNGGVIIDSGTSVTRLTESAYVLFRDAFRRGMVGGGLGSPGRFLLFDTCYGLGGRKEKEEGVAVPKVGLEFGGVMVELPAGNYMVPVDEKGTYCFAFAPVRGAMSIIGNIQQQGFRIVYDLENSRVGFAPSAC